MLFHLAIASFIATAVLADNYATYPQVPQTASINGFADPIYSKLPSCARDCVKASTGNTPCPYWDTGCLCVMPQWSGEVAECFAQQCKGDEVVSATSLAMSLCSSAGANKWMMPASISSELASAAGAAADAKATNDASQTGDDSASSASHSSAVETSTNSAASVSQTGSTDGSATTSAPAETVTSSKATSSASATSASKSAGAGAIVAAPVGLLGMMVMLLL